MCLLFTNHIGTIHMHSYMQFPTIRWSQSLHVPSFPLPSGCEAGRGGVHITRRDDLHFRWWVHQVGRGCWVGWSIEDYWVIWQGGGWSLLGGVFSYHELEWNWTNFCGKVKNPTLVLIFLQMVWCHQRNQVSSVEVFVELSDALLAVLHPEN